MPDELKAAARAAVETHVAAAYEGLVGPLEAMTATVSADGYDDHAGVQALPDGAAYYRMRLREQTSTRLSPEEVHTLGHAEVKRIMDEMATTIAKLAAAGDRIWIRSFSPSRSSHCSPLTSHLSRLMSHVSRLTSHLSRLISHVSSLTSHVSPLPSHLRPLTSDLSPPTPHPDSR